MDGIYAVGTSIDLSYTLTHASMAGANAHDTALLGSTGGGDILDLSGGGDIAQAYDTPGGWFDLLSGASDNQTLEMMIALIILSSMLGEEQGGMTEDLLGMLGQMLSGAGEGESGTAAMQSMTLSYSYESISVGSSMPAGSSYGMTDVMA